MTPSGKGLQLPAPTLTCWGDQGSGRAVARRRACDDYAFIAIGSMTAESRIGDDDHAPEPVPSQFDGVWTLWEHMVRGCGCMPVVKNKNTLELVGVVTERDVVERSGAMDV